MINRARNADHEGEKTMIGSSISELPTPCLLLDKSKMERNIRRMANRMKVMGGTLRPHVKTHKSIEVAQSILSVGRAKGVTVSTLREADYFFDKGIVDIMYAVGIAPNKFEHTAGLIEKGCDLKIVLDSVEMAERVAADGEVRGLAYKVLIELDTDGHRSGVPPKSDVLMKIGSILNENSGVELAGVMTHAGKSYSFNTPEDHLSIARQERDLTVLAAKRIREEGIECPMVSIGSTPTALSVDGLSGVTEVRAGVYVFFDLVMAGIGVCASDDIAISVLANVIGYQKEKGWVITDAGWMAMSRDRGTENQNVDYGYGLVLDARGMPLDSLIVEAANQEHGIIIARNGKLDYGKLPMGTFVRVLPNHACATGGQYDRYYVVDGDRVIAEWPRINGW